MNKENKKYILIHSASGGVGSEVTRYLGYEKVIGTCSKKKRRYALEVLGYDDVFDSRSVSFAKDKRIYKW